MKLTRLKLENNNSIAINRSLDKLSKEVLFPEKLEEANEVLTKAELPK